MPVTAIKIKPLWTKPVEVPGESQPRQEYVAPLTKENAKKLTLARFGDWNEETGKGRNAGCFACGTYQMAVTPGRKGVLLACNECHAEKRGRLLFDAARAEGFELGAGPDRRRRRGDLSLHPASESALAGLKKAEKRVLAFCAGKTMTRDYFEVPGRSIVGACRVSWRDVIPLLNRLAERGLIRVRSNNYAAKRPTQVAFLVDPVDLVKGSGRPENASATMVAPFATMVAPWNASKKW
jgi:hypothetical protein